MSQETLIITHVAVVFDGVTYALPKPNRHHDVMRLIHEKTGQTVVTNDQGFLTQHGHFLSRRAAFILAKRNGQLRRPADGYQGQQLFSEDIW